jgi:hypothetical protein
MKVKKPPYIILIVMDCVNAKHLSVYGYHRKTSTSKKYDAIEQNVNRLKGDNFPVHHLVDITRC